MSRQSKNIIIGILFLLTAAFTVRKATPVYFETPAGWPKAHYDFSKNKLTEEGFELGRHLFYDPILSKDSTISCASCHLQATAFAHVDHALSHGIEGKIGTRNSLSLVNLAWSENFMWDGGVNHLDMQPLNPITSPVEMNESLDHVVTKIRKSKKYTHLFDAAFGDPEITGQRVLKALSQFEVMLVSANSKYDKVMRNEAQFSQAEQNGYQLFKINCASCHTEPLFTNNHFEYNGLSVDSTLNDSGRMKITNNDNDYLRFKVPTLRNVQFSFPYMHDGRYKNLTEVIKHYNNIPNNKLLPKQLGVAMNLSDNDRVDLVSFLKTLTDNEFLFNPRFSFPRE